MAGTALGLVTGYFRGIVDDVVSRILEAFMAIPVVIVALLAIVALGTSKTTVIVAAGPNTHNFELKSNAGKVVQGPAE